MELPFSLSKVRYRWVALGWTLAIIVACTLPPSSLAKVEPVLGFDKAIHAGLFFLFGGLWMRALCPPGREFLSAKLRRRGSALLIVGLIFAGGLEVYQEYLPFRRVADPYDAIANGVGLVGGISAYLGYLQWNSE